MKKVILKISMTMNILFVIFLINSIIAQRKQKPKLKLDDSVSDKVELDSTVVKDSIIETDLIKAIIYVESRGSDSAFNKRTEAAGCMQIRPIMVKEVNRILSMKGDDRRFTLPDRFSRLKSIEMFNIWRMYWHSKGSYEEVARCWNGGINGHKKSSTKDYWVKVKKFLNNKL